MAIIRLWFRLGLEKGCLNKIRVGINFDYCFTAKKFQSFDIGNAEVLNRYIIRHFLEQLVASQKWTAKNMLKNNGYDFAQCFLKHPVYVSF